MNDALKSAAGSDRGKVVTAFYQTIRKYSISVAENMPEKRDGHQHNLMFVKQIDGCPDELCVRCTECDYLERSNE